VDMERMIEIDDPVYSFSEVMRHIDLILFLNKKLSSVTGRKPLLP